jgi:hypothetical protein
MHPEQQLKQHDTPNTMLSHNDANSMKQDDKSYPHPPVK